MTTTAAAPFATIDDYIGAQPDDVQVVLREVRRTTTSGLYPVPTAGQALEQDLARYRSGKDTVRLPLREPIPYGLVERVAALLVRRRVDCGD